MQKISKYTPPIFSPGDQNPGSLITFWTFGGYTVLPQVGIIHGMSNVHILLIWRLGMRIVQLSNRNTQQELRPCWFLVGAIIFPSNVIPIQP